jgi:hypothetical protein
MNIISLKITTGLFSNDFLFKKNINLIHSSINSVGKTTLLRFILFSLGYPIPNMKGINFNNFDLDLLINDQNNNQCHIQRRQDFISYITDDETISYSLPHDLYELHKKIFNIENIEILENLLGSFYLDQEKGWTLLNRGIVIGKIRFNIEGLIRGLSNRSDKALSDKLEALRREQYKYKYMFDVSKYQMEIKQTGENIAFDTPNEEINNQIKIMENERIPIANELDRIRMVIKDNNKLIEFISLYNITVVNDDGVEIIVNAHTIKGYNDNVNYLIAKRKMYEKRITDIDKKIFTLQKQQKKDSLLINLETTTQAFDAKLLNISVDQVEVQRILNKISQEIKVIETEITNKVKIDNDIVAELHNSIKYFANKLQIDEKYVRPYEDFIFTDDLKSLSGAIFHKIVFCFKMSYIKIISSSTGVKLPIILDSPSGREIDEINIAEMIEILKTDFSEHQIIIASIHTYLFEKINIIELIGRLLNSDNKEKEDNPL